MKSRAWVWLVLCASGIITMGCSDGANKTAHVDVPEVKEVAKQDTGLDIFKIETYDLAKVEFVPEEGEFLWPCNSNEECDDGWCIPTKDGGRCTTVCITDCLEGWVCVKAPTDPDIIYICIPRFTHLCDPCNSNDDCMPADVETTYLEDHCLPFGADGKFCGGDCSDGTPCPSGYECQTVTIPGGSKQQCLPPPGEECDCSPLAIQLGKSTECYRENQFGTCTGLRVCDMEGLSGCDAPDPEAEMCDDEDNDCDGYVDEGCDDDSDGFCDSTMDTAGQPAACGSGGGDCNDGDPAIFPGASEECDSKDNDCNGIIDDGLCEDGDPCTDDICDPIEGCSHVKKQGPCEDGNPCTENDFCDEAGICEGVPKSCDDGNPCTDNLCNQVTGECYWPNNSSPCDDEGNPCTNDVCENGTCQHKLASNMPCDDGNPCTVGDTCNSGQCASGAPADCDDDEQCTADSCDQGQGCVHAVMNDTQCIYPVEAFGQTICEVPGTCGSNGCVPQPTCDCPNCFLCVCCTVPIFGMVEVCVDNLLPGG